MTDRHCLEHKPFTRRRQLATCGFGNEDAPRNLSSNEHAGQDHRLEVVAYDPRWPAAFEAEAVRLRAALGPLVMRIDHHGSTSIPGLGAKPIIDIQVSVAALQPLATYAARLEAIGYVHVPQVEAAVERFRWGWTAGSTVARPVPGVNGLGFLSVDE